MDKEIKEKIKTKVMGRKVNDKELDKLLDQFGELKEGYLILTRDLITKEGRANIFSEVGLHDVSIGLFKALLDNYDLIPEAFIHKEGYTYWNIPTKGLMEAVSEIKRDQKRL